MHCSEFSDLLEAYLEDTLDGPTRRAFREHLGGCDGCRMVAVQKDPSLLFCFGGAEEHDPGRIEDLTRAVMGDIRRQRLRRRLHRPSRGWLRAAAAVVISVAAVMGWRLLSPANVDAPQSIVAVQPTEQVNPPPRVEVDMAGEGVRVYQYADQQDADTAVYFIVNPAMEL